MLKPRIIPCLLIRNGGLVKTVRFGDAKYVGDPINAVKIFNEKRTDELIVLDIDATGERREPNFKLIAQLAVECRMPLCYGGGIKTVEQAKKIIGLGVEKVALSSAVIENPKLTSQIADEIGSQSVAVVLDTKRPAPNKDAEVWIQNGAKNTRRTALELAREAEQHGAGEIVINAIDRDGRMEGYDIALAKQIRQSTRIPMTVLGGAGSLADLAKLIGACGIVGAAAGSLFVFKGAYRAVLINYPNPEQKDALIDQALRDSGFTFPGAT